MKLTVMAAVVALNLSHVPVEGLTQHAYHEDNPRLADNNPFSGARSISVDMLRDEWYTRKEAVPCAAIWDNGLKQTAQQYVAILSLLESSIPEDYDVLIRVRRDWLRLRDRQLIEDMFKQWR